jgi:hypothetical protein
MVESAEVKTSQRKGDPSRPKSFWDDSIDFFSGLLSPIVSDLVNICHLRSPI